jgi:hypothetical protein
VVVVVVVVDCCGQKLVRHSKKGEATTINMASTSTSSGIMIPFERYGEEFKSLTEQVTSKLRAFDHPNAISCGGFQQKQPSSSSGSGVTNSGDDALSKLRRR